MKGGAADFLDYLEVVHDNAACEGFFGRLKTGLFIRETGKLRPLQNS